MENKTSKEQSFSKANAKDGLIEGIKIGLITFIISYIIIFLISWVINLTAMDAVQSAVLGAIHTKGSLNFGGMIKLTSIILSFSVFNNISNLNIGMLIFSFIPFLVLFIVKRKCRTKQGIDLLNIYIYFVVALVYSIVLTLLQALTQGKFLEISIKTFSFRNFITTLVVMGFLQLIIGLNYNKKSKAYIQATRWLFRMSLGLGLILSLIDFIRIIFNLPLNILSKITAGIAILPNLIIYKYFMIMGVDIQTSESLGKLLEKIGMGGNTSSGVALIIGIIGILAWIAIVILSLRPIKQEKYFLNISLFALLFSIISTFLAYVTSINLGRIILVGEMSIGIQLLQAFLVPFLSILALGVMLWLIRKMIAIIKEI